MKLSAEKKLWKEGYSHVIGCDEAGRGPLAGPVVAAAVLMAPDFRINTKACRRIRDSKLVPEKERELIFEALCSDSRIKFAVHAVSPAMIDAINIHQASLKAMSVCINELISEHAPEKPFVLLDGRFTCSSVRTPQRAVIDGDADIFSIAAASIIAKVTRDRIMRTYHDKYPAYNFARHKGYATEEHRTALKLNGPCPLHRRSFLGNISCETVERIV